MSRLASWLVLFLLAIGLCAAVRAHDAPEPPRLVEELNGSWPAGVAANVDIVVPMLVTVAADGSVSDPQIDVSLGAALDQAAIEAVLRWRFEPARGERGPVAARARVAVRFRAAPAPEPDAGVADAGDAVVPIADADVADAMQPAPTEHGAVARGERPVRSASELVRDRELLSAAPHRTGSDLLRTVPGVFLTQHSGEGKANQIFYRGFDAVHGQDVEIWVGGAPVNEVSNIHGQGYADLHFVMPEVVRSLRATPGNYDPRQGDFAVAGSMRFELGYDQPGLTGKAGYGSYGTTRYFLAYRPKQAGEGTFGAVEVYDTDGFGPSRAARRASAITQASWSLGNATEARVLLTGYAAHFDSAGVLRLSDIQSGRVGRFATYDADQGGASLRSQLVGEIRRQTRDSGFSIAPYVVLRSLRLRQNFTGYLLDADGDSVQQLNDTVTLGGTAYYRLRHALLSPRDAFEVGVSTRSDWIDQSQRRLASSDQRVTSTDVDAQLRALDVAGYFDAAVSPHSMLTLRAGVRIDGLAYSAQDQGGRAAGQARASQGTHFGKRATLELRPGLGIVLLASYGEGFRSPQARSLAESQRTPFTRVRSTELGARFEHPQISASGALFRTWLSQDLVFDPVTVRNEAVPATQRTGVTLDGSYKPLSWLLFNLNLTYTRAEFRKSQLGYRAGDLVPYAPQLVARSDLAATPVLGTWRDRTLRGLFGVGVSALAKRPLPYALEGHDIFLLDAQAQVRWGEIGVSLKAYNLLDARWYDGEFLYASSWNPAQQAASLLPIRHVTVGAPRTLFAALEFYL